MGEEFKSVWESKRGVTAWAISEAAAGWIKAKIRGSE